MSEEYLPLKVDPFRFADNATCLQGSLPIINMQRLSSSVSSDKAEVLVRIDFGKDEQGLRILRGHLATCLTLQCQRCMESFNYEIISDLALGIVKTVEEANHLPSCYDPLIVEGSDLYIQDVIEDELIINLPIVPMHSASDCKIKLPLMAESDVLQRIEKDNPFKVVELLRNKRDKL